MNKHLFAKCNDGHKSLPELEAELSNVRFKRQMASRMGWSENVGFWWKEQGRLEAAIAKAQRPNKRKAD